MCTASGLCELRLFTIRLGTVTIRPYIEANGEDWDGLGHATNATVQAVTAALVSGGPYVAVLNILGGLAFGATAPPDAYGSATLTINGQRVGGYDLGVFDDDVRPFWRDVEWGSVPIGADDDLRLELVLTDEDNLDDDAIGRVVVPAADLRAAEESGGLYPANTSGQGSRNILFVEIEVIPQD